MDLFAWLQHPTWFKPCKFWLFHSFQVQNFTLSLYSLFELRFFQTKVIFRQFKTFFVTQTFLANSTCCFLTSKCGGWKCIGFRTRMLAYVQSFHFHYYSLLSFLNNMFVCFQTTNSLVPWNQDDFQLHSRQ